MQLKDGIKQLIATGKYPPGCQLPTVRQLAVELKINANTVSRVYSELESEGILASRQGKGTFVRDQQQIDLKARQAVLSEMIDSLIVQTAALGFSVEELLSALKKKVKEQGTDG